MAINPQFKVNKMAKDLGMKSKDLSDILTDHGIEVKTQRTLEPQEFDVLFETLTRSHQITNIEDYLDGVTCIPSKKQPESAPATPAAPQPKAPEVKSQPAQAPVKETKAEAAPKAQPKVEAKPEVKAEPKTETKAEVKSEVKAEPKTEPKTEAKPEVKVEPKPEAKPEVKVEPKAETKPEVKAAPAQDKRPETKSAPEREARRDNRDSRDNRDNRDNRQQSTRPQQSVPGARPADNRPQQQGARPAAPGGKPFERSSDRPMNTRPQGDGAQGQRPQRPTGDRPMGDRPVGDRPMGQRPMGDRPMGDRPMNDRFGTKPPMGGGKPMGGAPKKDNRGGGMGGGFDKDRDYGQQVGGFKETFRPQATIRVQTEGKAVPRGATRVVDTRGSEAYDPSKYDEKLETFVSDRDDVKGGTSRVKKQQAPQTKGGMPGKGGFQKNAKDKFGKKKSHEPVHILPQSVTLPEEIMVSELASRLKVTSAEIIKRLMLMGMMATVNQTVDYDTAALVADELGIPATKEVVVSIEERLFDEAEDTAETLQPRAPVVCVMGHVDHGKTSLLDAIRHTHVTAGEAGGITQHIGAYRVKIQGQDITFLDTPGHEAFTAMRARGAQATDIAILVVAADDGIMPQTVEAIHHAKAAGIDIIVAINKMDKPTANPENIKQELTKYDLVPEEWGGDVMCVPVSALTGQGIDDLLESVLLVAEVKELKANPNRRAKGIVIEAKLDRGRGPVATVLVQNGTLHDGDIVIAGTAVGHVRAMTDHRGKTVKVAGPSVPVEITGLAETPTAGDEFQAVADERMARELADKRKNQAKEEGFKANARANLNDLFKNISEGIKTLNIIVKADVVGSAEAVKASLLKISNEEVRVAVIHAAAGGVNEGDVMLAAASDAIIVGFNVRPDKAALDSAERQGVEIRSYRVIYDAIEEITAAMKGMLAPKFQEVLLGHAEVRQTIHVPGVGTIAGSYVTDGKVARSAQIRVLRDSIVIFEDSISSLKRFKDDAREVAQGYECGIGLEKFNDIKIGDVLEAFVMEEVKQN